MFLKLIRHGTLYIRWGKSALWRLWVAIYHKHNLRHLVEINCKASGVSILRKFHNITLVSQHWHFVQWQYTQFNKCFTADCIHTYIHTGLMLHKDRLTYSTNSMHTVMKHHAETQINHPYSKRHVLCRS